MFCSQFFDIFHNFGFFSQNSKSVFAAQLIIIFGLISSIFFLSSKITMFFFKIAEDWLISFLALKIENLEKSFEKLTKTSPKPTKLTTIPAEKHDQASAGEQR